MTTVVQFSGGADSLATLWLSRSVPDVCALWIKTDGAYNDTQDYVERVCQAAGVPLYIEFTQRKIEEYGFPADIVPQQVTPLGRFIHGTDGPLVQPYFECCSRAIWDPMRRRSAELGATVIVRGMKASDSRKIPLKHGEVVNGVRYEFPIYDWSTEKVFSYLRSQCPELIPPYYSRGERTSRDCWDCTAYCDDNAERVGNLSPVRKAVVHHRLQFIARAAHDTLDALREVRLASAPQMERQEVTQ